MSLEIVVNNYGYVEEFNIDEKQIRSGRDIMSCYLPDVAYDADEEEISMVAITDKGKAVPLYLDEYFPKNTKTIKMWIGEGQYETTETVWDKEEEDFDTEIKCQIKDEMDIELKKGVYEKIMARVKLLGKDGLECGGLLIGEKDEDTMTITDIKQCKQEVSGGNVEFDMEAMTRFMRENQDKEWYNKIIGWWHSHHNMSCFWSSTDDEQFDTFLQGFDKTKECVGLVFVSTGKFLARIDIKHPYLTASFDDYPVELEDDKLSQHELDKIQKEAEKEMKDIVLINESNVPVIEEKRYDLDEMTDKQKKKLWKKIECSKDTVLFTKQFQSMRWNIKKDD